MRLAAVPAAMELPVPCPRSVPTEPRFPDYASSSLQLAASYPPVQLGPAQSYSLPANPSLSQHPVASAMNELTSATRELLKSRMKNPNAGPVRQVSSQLTFYTQEQARHQEEFELRKRNENEEAAMRAGRAGLWKRRRGRGGLGAVVLKNSVDIREVNGGFLYCPEYRLGRIL